MIEVIYNASEPAIAAYANLVSGSTADQPDALTANNEMSAKQAEEFARRYPTVITQFTDTTTSFGATVFADASGNLTLAIRGTQEAGDFVPTDADIVRYGAAYDQIVAMVNWWQRASTASGSVAQYALVEYPNAQVAQPPADAVRLYPTELAFGGRHLYLVRAADGTASGELVAARGADADGRLDLTGHSLGSHLALAFNTLFSLQVGQVVGFNGPGFIDTQSNRDFFVRLGGALPVEGNSSNVTNVNADESGTGQQPWRAVAGLHSRPGVDVDIAIEDQWLSDEPNPTTGRWNHSQMMLTDSLAVYALLARLDPALSAANFKSLLGAAAVGTAASYERIVDALERLVNVDAALLPAGNQATNRDALYQAIYGLRGNAAYAALIGKMTLELTAESNLATAKTDFSSFLALQMLCPFVLHTDTAGQGILMNAHALVAQSWQADNNARFYGDTSRDFDFSDPWYGDRAAMLAAVMLRNSFDLSGVLPANPVQGVYAGHYLDVTSGTDLVVGLDIQTTPQYLFGSSSVDAPDNLLGQNGQDHLYGGSGNDSLAGLAGGDYLEGNADNDSLDAGTGADKLLGGSGNDTLDGGADADTLLGGTGDDTYILRAQDGVTTDRIADADGLGNIKVVAADGIETTLGEGAIRRLADGSNLWQSEDRRFTYGTVTESDGSTTLTISGSGVAARVGNFTSGQLGISLEGQAPEQSTPPADGLVIVGDLQWVEPPQFDALGNAVTTGVAVPDRPDVLYDSAGHDQINSGGGADRVYATRGGDDWIQTGSAWDYAEGGAGDDLIELGSDRDAALGGAGDDQLYGDMWTPLQPVLAQTQAAGSDHADLLSGGEGNDTAVGGSSADALFGGDGRDLLAGGAGDDNMFGDRNSRGTDYFFWNIGRAPILDGTGNVVGVDLISSWIDPVMGAAQDADLLFGGAGADAMTGDGGDDYLDGGVGADTMVGGAGADVMFGAEDNDLLHGDGNTTNAASFIFVSPDLHGNDRIDGGDGNDTLVGDGANDELVGGLDNDVLAGDSDDLAVSWHGADTLDGGGGQDSLYGGGGADRLSGGDEADALFGDRGVDVLIDGQYHGTDWLDGGEGGDQLVGDGGDDELTGGAGADYLYGDNPFVDAAYHGADFMDGGDDDDQLVGGGKGDTLIGGDGADLLFGDDDGAFTGDEGADLLDGGAGSDYLQGYGGNDTLRGGTGYDQLLGQGGNDTYVFTAGDTSPGLDLAEYVDDAEGVNHVSLDGMDIASMSLVATTDAEVHLLQTGQDSIFIRGLRTGAIGTVQVSGITYSANEFFGQTYAAAISESTSEPGSDLQGGKLADNLTGTGGNSTLAGGDGTDTLTASGGNNTFAYNLGDGTDTITDNSPLLDANGNPQTSKVVFGAGIAPDAIQLGYVGSALRIGFGADQPDALLINGFNPNNALAVSSIDRFEFADGTTLTRAELLARGFDLVGTAAIDVITGTNLSDRLAGGAGADLVAGRSGDDVYLFNPGDGADTIADADTLLGGNDTLRFGAGIYADSVEARRSFNQLQLIAGTDIVSFQNYFVGGADVVEHVEFADGTHWTAADIQARLSLGSSGNDSIVGDGTDNQLFGQGGDDQLYGMAGSDFLSGGAGVDTLEGGEGDDRYFFSDGDGSEFIIETGGADILEFGPGITPDDIVGGQSGNDMWLSLIGVPGGVEVRNHFLPGTDDHKIEAILFADGTVWGQADVVELALRATDGNDFIEGFSLDDVIDARAGDDSVFAAGGNDTITGGTGFDALHGQAGNDTYVFGFNAGSDLVAEDNGGLVSDIDRLVYLDGISYADVSFKRTGNDLVISSVVKGFDTRVANQFATNTNANGVELVSFADGATLDRTMLRQEALRASNGNDTLEGTDGGELIDGLAGDDWIYGQGGNDTLRGGPGLDHVFGGQGDDTFVYQLGDQADSLGDGDYLTGNGGGGLEVLNFGVGIAASSVTPSRAAGHLLLTVSATDQVHVLRYFERGDFELVGFADGTVWTQATIGQMLPINGTEGADSMSGTNSADYMYGLGNGTGTADTIRGFGGDDVVDGGAGEDRIYGGFGNDLIQGGADTSRKIAYRDSLNGEAGNDWLIAGSAPADMVGGAGSDLDLGAAGADTFTEDATDGSHNFMYGAAGTDNLRMYGGGAGLAIGGAGGDTINGGSGSGSINSRLVVAFNKSDGIDMVGLLGSGSTISIGGGALYSNLSFQVNGANLRLKTGSSHYVELVGWYSGAPGEGKNVATLQIVTEGTREYSASSSDPMKNRKIQTFDFLGLANAFDVARAAGQNFNLANNLAAFRIGGSDTEMVGGAIAYQYARTGNLGALSYPQMQAVIDAPEFGTSAQPTAAPSGLAMAEASMAADSSIESSTIEMRTASTASPQHEMTAWPAAGLGTAVADSNRQDFGGRDPVAQWFKPTRETDLSFQDEILRGESGVGSTGPGNAAAAWKRSHRWLDRNVRGWGVESDANTEGADLTGLSYLGLDHSGFDMPRSVVGLRGVAGHQFRAFQGLQEGIQPLGRL